MFSWYAIGFILLLIASCEYYTAKTGVPTVTSFPLVRKKMIALLKAEEERLAAQTKDKPFTVLDLGSGTGKLTLEMGRALPRARIIGLEISLVPFLLSRLRRLLWRVKNVEYRREDFWAYDISALDAVTIYMNAKIRDRMAEKMKELPVGALIISNETQLPGWTPVETHDVKIFARLLEVKVVVYRR